jgi:hypothetical protein
MKHNQITFIEGCSHYIFINELSPVMEKYKSKIVGFNDFYQIYIPVQEKFYLEFKLSPSKEVMLSIELDKNLIIDFEKYFKNSVNLTFQSEIIIENNNILLCKLEDIACF